MTNATDAPGTGVKRAAKTPRTANTLRLHHLMEERQRLEIAERIRQLRERSRWTQPQVAEKLGLSLRGYQKLEQRGTTKWERAEEIANIHGVDTRWIWDGGEQPQTPDLMANDGDKPTTQLDRIEGQLTELLERVGRLEAVLLSAEVGRRTAEGSPRSGEAASEESSP